jgi:D-glycero-alpha-D-manno-heptose-7-phosphate kinase
MSSARIIQARSPLRIDFVGMTDYVPACQRFGGSIINATINKYIYATVMERHDGLVILHAPDRGDKRVVIEGKEALNPDGELGLAQEIIRRFDLPTGVELTTYSEMPAGAGLGSSSTIATCIIAALDALTGYRLSAYQMAELARECETVALRTTYGWQDQYSPVTGGGVKYMKYWPQDLGWYIEVDQLPLHAPTVAELEKSLVVCYSGISRPAKQILDAVAIGVEGNDPGVVGALRDMSCCADEIKLAMLQAEIGGLGALLSEIWQLHKRLHPDVTNERIEELFQIALAAGATGGRVCGAGGGGAMIFHCAPNRDYAVRHALAAAEARVFDWSLDRNGIIIW